MEITSANQILIEAISLEVKSSRTQHVEISGVDWKITSGDYWIVGGPHDSGKTDLLTTVAGLQKPLAGALRLFGRDIGEMREPELLKLRARAGFVFKGGGRMFTELTVAENVALPLCYHRNWTAEEAQADVHATLEITELTEFATETAERLGANVRQRVGLARALALKPEILFLDEPIAGQELRHRQWWQKFLEQLISGEIYGGGQKATVIVATNDFSLWPGKNHLSALIKDKHWHILGQPAELPLIE